MASRTEKNRKNLASFCDAIKLVSGLEPTQILCFLPPPFLRVDGSPKDQLLAVYQSIILYCLLPKPGLRSQLISVEYQTWAPSTMIARTQLTLSWAW